MNLENIPEINKESPTDGLQHDAYKSPGIHTG